MRFVWEENDIICGRKFGKKGVSERYIIGYGYPEKLNKVYYIISLQDGLVSDSGSASSLASDLTQYGYVPFEYLTE